MGLTRPLAGILARPPELRHCTLCATAGHSVIPHWQVAYASGETALVACDKHLAESMTMAAASQSAEHLTVYDMSRDVT